MVHKSKENDLLTLIYTEQRAPLKVLCYLTKILSNIVSVSKLVRDIFSVKFFIILPLSHVLERTSMVTFY